ncbi:MAG: NAD(P)H-dependent oxidoreductase [Blautia sp.]|nr:NAD(P)H-dependent oxidoreductase [Blautia sp.]MCM1201268.1 NAD(P)H-dependent oxidoreductase [Bacteroides fragilis]
MNILVLNGSPRADGNTAAAMFIAARFMSIKILF